MKMLQDNYFLKKKSWTIILVILLVTSSVTFVFLSEGTVSENSSINTTFEKFSENSKGNEKLDQFISFDVNKLRKSKADVVIIYDESDIITSKTAGLFNEFLGGEALIDSYGVNSMDDVHTALKLTRKDQVVIFIAHGLPKEFRIGSSYFPWQNLILSIETSQTENFIIASCFSSQLENSTSKNIRGIEGVMDYEVAAPIFSFYTLDYLYEIDENGRYDTVQLIQNHLDTNSATIIPKMISPENVLGKVKEKRTLVYYSNELWEKLDQLYNKTINLITSKITPLINKIQELLFTRIPLLKDIYSSTSMSVDPDEIALHTNLFKVDAGFEDIITNEFSIDVNYNKSLKKEVEIELNSHLNLSLEIEFFHDEMANGQTEYQYAGWGIRGTVTLETTKPFSVEIPAYGLKLIMDIDFKFQIGIEYLIKHESHDPDHEYTSSSKISPDTQIYNDEDEIAALIGYKSIENLMGEELTLESWYGIPDWGIPPAFRLWGMADILLGFRIGSIYETIMKKINHAEEKLEGSLAEIEDSEVSFSIARVSGTAFFSSAGDGLLISFNLITERGPRLEIKIESEYYEINFEGMIVVRLPASLTIKMGSEGVKVHKAELYYPKFIIKLDFSVEFKLEVNLLTISHKIGTNYDTTFYAPNGKLNDPKAGQSLNDFNAGLIITPGSSESNTVVDSTSIFNNVLCPAIDNLIDISGVQGTCETISNTVFGHTTTTRVGTVADSDPPSLIFMTPNTNRDDIFEYPTFDGTPHPEYEYLDNVTVVNSNFEETPISASGVIEGIFSENNGSVSIQHQFAKPIPLVGDEAFVDIYTFDEHDSNPVSYVKHMKVSADFSENKETNVILPNDLVYDTIGSHTLKPFSVETKMRIFIDLAIVERNVIIKDDNGDVIASFLADTMTATSTVGKANLWLPWTQTSYFTIEISEGAECSSPPCISEPIAYVKVKSIETIHEIEYFTDIDVNTNLATQDFGALHVTHRDDEVANGWGPFSGLSGAEAIWRLEMPLHLYYEAGLIPVQGTVRINVQVYDTAGLKATKDKVYHYKIPIDNTAPIIYTTDFKSQEAYEVLDLSIASTGFNNYDYTYSEVTDVVTYSYSWGSGSSSYNIHSGLNPSTINQNIDLMIPESKVITTISSGLDNEFTLDLGINSLNPNLSFDLRSAGVFRIEVDYQTTLGTISMIVDSSTQTTYVDGQDYYLGLSALNVNAQDWTRIYLDPLANIGNYLPGFNVTGITDFSIRGSVDIDNIIIDGTTLMDGTTASGWTTSDTTPSGYDLVSRYVFKPEKINVNYSWDKVSGSEEYDNGMLMSLKYRLELDTTQLADGEYFLELSAQDNDMHGAAKLFRILVDNTAPNPFSITSTIPDHKDANGNYHYTIEFEASSDNIGIDKYQVIQYVLDPISSEHLTYLSSTSTSFAVSGTEVFFNNNAFKVKAIDYASNTKSTSVKFVDLSADYDGDTVTDKEEMDIGSDPLSTDSDGDGLSDKWEYKYGLSLIDGTGVNGPSGDPDGDGLTNLEEVSFATNPKDSDTDGDDLPDGWEIDYGLSPIMDFDTEGRDGDPDDDGMTNYEEYLAGTDPLLNDSDQDDLPDDWEIQYGLDPTSPYGSNGREGDPDNDGLTNLLELGFGTDPKDSTTDSDGLPDGWEVSHNFDPTSATGVDGDTGDPDGDGLDNLGEYNYGTDPRNSHTDSDSLPDGWEVTYGLDPNSALDINGDSGDPDFDSMTNLREYENSLSPIDSDCDDDGLKDGTEHYGWPITVVYGGNIQETFTVKSDPTDADSDDDGLNDYQEYVEKTNPNVSDTDYDSMADKWEVDYNFDPAYYPDREGDPDNDNLKNYQEEDNGTHPWDSDTDNDSMPDGWEVTYSLDPTYYNDRYNDPDGDGRNNVNEYWDGTNPNVYDTPFTVSNTDIYKGSTYIYYSFDYQSYFSGTIYIKLYRVDCSTCTNTGNLVKSTSKSIGEGSSSYSTTYNPSVTGYYRFHVRFDTSSGTKYNNWISGYAYHYEGSGGGGGGGGGIM